MSLISKKHKPHKWWTRNDDTFPRPIIALAIVFPIVSLSAWIWMVTMILDRKEFNSYLEDKDPSKTFQSPYSNNSN